MAVSERDIQTAILIELSSGDTRLFRVNAGMAWAGQVINRTADTITLKHPYPIRLGVEGMSDLLGITAGGKFASIEVKKPGHRTDKAHMEAQMRFIAMVNRLGGRAGIAESVEDARRILTGK